MELAEICAAVALFQLSQHGTVEMVHTTSWVAMSANYASGARYLVDCNRLAVASFPNYSGADKVNQMDSRVCAVWEEAVNLHEAIKYEDSVSCFLAYFGGLPCCQNMIVCVARILIQYSVSFYILLLNLY